MSKVLDGANAATLRRMLEEAWVRGKESEHAATRLEGVIGSVVKELRMEEFRRSEGTYHTTPDAISEIRSILERSIS